MRSRLTKRDFEVLDHVLRYRVATCISLHKALFAEAKYRAVGKVTRRLVRAGWLLQHPLGPRRCYFTLSPLADHLMGMPKGTATKAVEPRQLLRDYGMLKYCCLSEHGRNRLHQKELEEEYPRLLCRNLDSDRYYLDDGYRPALCGMIWVDRGEDVAQLVSECRKDWETRFRQPEFRKHVTQEGFRLVIVTATPDRAALLRQQVDQYDWPEKLRLAVDVLPRLLPLYLKVEASGSPTKNGSPKTNGKAPKRPCASVCQVEAREPQIMQRDYEILQHVWRYRIMTPKSLHTTFFSELTPHSALSVSTRLVRNGWLNRHLLGPQRCYYTISPRSARLLGNPPSVVTGPLEPRQLAREYGLLKYCCTGRNDRKRLTVADLQTDYPQLLCPGLNSDRYFIDTGCRRPLPGMAWEDTAGEPSETIAACHKDWAARWNHAEFRRYVRRNGFRLVLLAATSQRARALRQEVKKHAWPQNVRLIVETLPELVPLVVE